MLIEQKLIRSELSGGEKSKNEESVKAKKKETTFDLECSSKMIKMKSLKILVNLTQMNYKDLTSNLRLAQMQHKVQIFQTMKLIQKRQKKPTTTKRTFSTKKIIICTAVFYKFTLVIMTKLLPIWSKAVG